MVEPASDVYAGYLFVTPRRRAAGFADLDDEESAAIGRAITRWSRALERSGAERVYVLRVDRQLTCTPGVPVPFVAAALLGWSDRSRLARSAIARDAEGGLV